MLQMQQIDCRPMNQSLATEPPSISAAPACQQTMHMSM